MLPYDILAADNHVYSFEPACLLMRSQRFADDVAPNAWEEALLYVQEHDAPQTLPSVCELPASTLALRYCAAHVLLGKRGHLLRPERVDDWYMLLDGRTAFDDFDKPDYSLHSLGRLRTLYGIEWIHARATRHTPLQHIWFAGHHWPTLASHSTPVPESNKKSAGHNIERWSFLGNQWHIQHWVCERTSKATTLDAYSKYTSQVASPASVHNALNRTLLLDDDARLAAWESIPTHLRAQSLLDWTLAEPIQDHHVLPYLAHRLGVDICDLSSRLDLARTLCTPASTVLESMAMNDTAWPLPEDTDS